MAGRDAGAAAPAGYGGACVGAGAAAGRHQRRLPAGRCPAGSRRTSGSSPATAGRHRSRAATTSATSTASRPRPTSAGSGDRHGGWCCSRGGRPVVDSAWGEWLLDIRTPAKRKRPDGDHADLDAHLCGPGVRRRRVRQPRLVHPQPPADQAVAGTSPTRGCSCAWPTPPACRPGRRTSPHFDGRSVGYDFAVAEECGRYRECASYVAHYGRRVLSIEYRRVDFRWTCAHFGSRLPVVLRDRA